MVVGWLGVCWGMVAGWLGNDWGIILTWFFRCFLIVFDMFLGCPGEVVVHPRVLGFHVAVTWRRKEENADWKKGFGVAGFHPMRTHAGWRNSCFPRGYGVPS